MFDALGNREAGHAQECRGTCSPTAFLFLVGGMARRRSRGLRVGGCRRLLAFLNLGALAEQEAALLVLAAELLGLFAAGLVPRLGRFASGLAEVILDLAELPLIGWLVSKGTWGKEFGSEDVPLRQEPDRQHLHALSALHAIRQQQGRLPPLE